MPRARASSDGQALRGLGPAPGEQEALRGVGDIVTAASDAGSDVSDVVSTDLGNVAGTVTGLLTGISISSTTNTGPTFGPQGATEWHVAFATTGRAGWIVQEVDNTVQGTDDTGAALTPASIDLVPHYYEAWSVDATGTVGPSVAGDNDRWDQGSIGAGSRGRWSTIGTLYWVPGTTAPAGMAARAVRPAGMLVSSLATPPGLGAPRLYRYAHANWDSTVAPELDTGSASP